MSDVMADVRSLDRALLHQRELLESVKGICIGLERGQREQRRGGIDVATAVVRSLVCRLKTYNRVGATAEEMCETLYGQKGVGYTHTLQALRQCAGAGAARRGQSGTDHGCHLGRRARGHRQLPGLLPSLAPSSVYTQLSGRGLRVTLAPNAAIKLPARLSTPTLAGDFILEGSPIPARRLSLTATATISPHKLAVLSPFSWSWPNGRCR